MILQAMHLTLTEPSKLQPAKFSVRFGKPPSCVRQGSAQQHEHECHHFAASAHHHRCECAGSRTQACATRGTAVVDKAVGCGKYSENTHDMYYSSFRQRAFSFPQRQQGVAATLLVFWLRSARPRTKTSVNSQRKLLPHTDDHDRFHSEIQALHMVPEDLEIGPMLGTGTFGQVYRGRWKGTNVAVKVLKHGVAGEVSNVAVARERMIGLASVHPNVVAVYAVLTEEPWRRFSMQNPFASEGSSLKTSIVMELCDRGSLMQNRERIWAVMRQDYQRGLRWVLKCLLEIVYGMEYLHSIGVVHGDLKCANVMCSSKMTDMRGFVCKIADFGLARTSEGFTDMHSSSPGTALFAAPERLSSGSLGSHSDVYSFGMLAWHLVSMGSLAADLEEYQVRYQVVERGWRPPFPHQTPEFMQCIISRSWSDDREHRPGFTELRGILSDCLAAVKAAAVEPGEAALCQGLPA